MLLAALVALQSAYGPTLREDRPAPTPKPCPMQPTDDIVVCGRLPDPDRYRLKPLPPAPEGMPRAEVGLDGNARAAVAAEQTNVGGFPSKRIMVKLKLGF